MKARIHHLFVRAHGCVAEVALNGFPVVTLMPTGLVRSAAPPVNQLLVGRGNALTVTLWALPPAEQAPLEGAALRGSVRLFEPTDPSADAGGGEEVLGFGLGEEHLAPPGSGPWLLPLSLTTYRFDSSGASFRHRLLEGAPLERSAVLAYALELGATFRAQDRAGIARALGPKLRDYAEAYDAPEAGILRDLDAHLTNKLFARGLLLDFGPDELELTPHCGGRLWHVQQKGRQPFLQTRPDAAGLDSKMEVFVGAVDGALAVVR